MPRLCEIFVLSVIHGSPVASLFSKAVEQRSRHGYPPTLATIGLCAPGLSASATAVRTPDHYAPPPTKLTPKAKPTAGPNDDNGTAGATGFGRLKCVLLPRPNAERKKQSSTIKLSQNHVTCGTTLDCTVYLPPMIRRLICKIKLELS